MTLSALGIFSAAGAGGVAFSSDYELIETAIVSGSSTTSVTFSSLGSYSSIYKHLQVRSVYFGNGFSAFMRYNGDSGSGKYRSHSLYGNGSSVVSEDVTYARDKGMIGGFMGLSETIPLATVTDILDPYSTTKNKTTRSLGGRATGGVELPSHVWLDTASVTSVTVLTTAANFGAGSRFSLYGIKG